MSIVNHRGQWKLITAGYGPRLASEYSPSPAADARDGTDKDTPPFRTAFITWSINSASEDGSRLIYTES